jgi:hypothetical protein
MADLFKEILPSILQNKQNVMLTEQDEKSYPAFMVNRALSYYKDTVLISNEINKFYDLDNKLKYDFLLNMVRAKKRPWSSWHKKAQNADLDVIKEYYGYSDSKAAEALKILDDSQINEIKKKIYKGT